MKTVNIIKAFKIKKATYGRLRNGRIDWDAKTTQACITLAGRGFHARTISEYTGLTVSQVRSRLYHEGIRLRDYRDGATEEAMTIISPVSTVAYNEIKHLKEKKKNGKS